MKPPEAAECVKKLGKLFPGQLTKELAAWGAAEFLPFSANAVSIAIEQHRRTHEFVTWPQLLEGCRAAERGETMKGTVTTDREGTWFDVRRRQNPQYANRHDVEVALRVYRGWWAKCPQTDIWRRKLANQCTIQLLDAEPLAGDGARLDMARAEEWAMTIFESPDFFRQCLEQIRDTVPTSFMPASVPSAPAAVALLVVAFTIFTQ